MIWQLSGPITYAKALQGIVLFGGILILLTGLETSVLFNGRDKRKICSGYLPLCKQNRDYSALPWIALML